MRHTALTLCLLGATSLLVGCGPLGIETATQINAERDAEARAIGGACRHAVRSIEDCFDSNPGADKASVFAGWREMDEYMRENDMLGMPSQPVPSPTPAAPNSAAKAPTNPGAADPTSRRS